jgi:UDP-N-acetylglucosamine--N-acetylmuramyl-(pentapeptide) pyrophosphoryl-undecaprenol N-acetylglucosamine transferase
MGWRRGEPLRVVIAGGGTGGHLFPGIAVARELMRRDPATRVSFAGTERGIETRVLPREGLELDTIRSAGLKGKSPSALARGLALLPLSARDAWRVIATRKPHVVVGVGGYSSGPVVLLAASRGIATMVLEQNSVPGLTNRLLGRVVRAAGLTYEETLRWFPRVGFVSGNPVRPGFLEGQAAIEARTGRGVLVFGGSQGARAINDAMVASASFLASATPPIELVHQTGERDAPRVRTAYSQAGLTADVMPFIDEMEREMRRADLVVCRSGATSLAEVTVAGKPSLLVPLPSSTDDHQRKNAQALVRLGAAEMLEQSEATGDVLGRRIVALLDDRARLAEMRRSSKAAGRPDAASVIADTIERLAAA